MRLSLVLLLALCSSAAFAQDPQLSPDAPKDVPSTVARGALPALEDAIAPYIAEAKRTYPAAKEKFLAGLPDGQSFFITTRLYESSGAFEQVFIAVRSIEGGVISGRVWSDINRVQGYKHGDAYTFTEADILDWLITHPDGTEDGNFVGKYLDSLYQSGT
jgi:hypothetical protein